MAIGNGCKYSSDYIDKFVLLKIDLVHDEVAEITTRVVLRDNVDPVSLVFHLQRELLR